MDEKSPEVHAIDDEAGTDLALERTSSSIKASSLRSAAPISKGWLAEASLAAASSAAASGGVVPWGPTTHRKTVTWTSKIQVFLGA